jgi:predicted 3-demethylubiquinone-9 3-methyltransferase (glyoxalase superfamily)
MQKIVTSLWFEDQAEEAANFYVSLFPNSRVLNVVRFGDAGPGEAGKVMVVEWVLDGQEFNGINGGPEFKFSEATSLIVNTEDQEETDRLWNALTADGGEESMCGWLKDKFGFSWQIVPKRLTELMADPDPGRAERATKSMLQMRKINIAEIERAADAEAG